MSDYIFNPNSSKTAVSSANDYYCVKGKEDFLDTNGLPRKNQDSNDVLAKKILKEGGQPQYYIKVSNINKLYNPVNKHSDAISSNDDGSVVNHINAKNLMITHTSGQKVNTVAIMTKDASSLGDKIKTESSSTSNRNDGAIFRPKKNK
jgi:hypothetical protein